MKGDRLTDVRSYAVIGVLTLALLMRILVPTGWMPATDGGYTITLCTGMGIVEASVDKDGNVQKDKPSPSKVDQPCAFSGFSAAFDLPAAIEPANGPIFAHASQPVALPLSVSIGHGLAAPPPPPTGPPVTL